MARRSLKPPVTSLDSRAALDPFIADDSITPRVSLVSGRFNGSCPAYGQGCRHKPPLTRDHTQSDSAIGMPPAQRSARDGEVPRRGNRFPPRFGSAAPPRATIVVAERCSIAIEGFCHVPCRRSTACRCPA